MAKVWLAWRETWAPYIVGENVTGAEELELPDDFVDRYKKAEAEWNAIRWEFQQALAKKGIFYL